MQNPEKIGTLGDVILRLDRHAGREHDGVARAVGAVEAARQTGFIPDDPRQLLARALLLVWDDDKHFSLGSEVAAMICDDDRGIGSFDRISALYYIARRNVTGSETDGDFDPRPRGRSRSRSAAHPSAEIADRCGRKLFAAVDGLFLPDEGIGREDKLRCYAMVLGAVNGGDAMQIKITATRRMMALVRFDSRDGQMQTFRKAGFLNLALARLPPGSGQAADVAALLKSLENPAPSQADPSSSPPVPKAGAEILSGPWGPKSASPGILPRVR